MFVNSSDFFQSNFESFIFSNEIVDETSNEIIPGIVTTEKYDGTRKLELYNHAMHILARFQNIIH